MLIICPPFCFYKVVYNCYAIARIRNICILCLCRHARSIPKLCRIFINFIYLSLNKVHIVTDVLCTVSNCSHHMENFYCRKAHDFSQRQKEKFWQLLLVPVLIKSIGSNFVVDFTNYLGITYTKRIFQISYKKLCKIVLHK